MRLKASEVRVLVLETLELLHETTRGRWPLHEAFTDLDDYSEDNDPGFNHEVGYVRGLCTAMRWDVGRLCAVVESRFVLFCESCGEIPVDFTVNHTPECSVEHAACRIHHACDSERA